MARTKANAAAILPPPVSGEHFIRVHSGAKFFFGDMSKNTFDIDTIATHLAATPRFAGATKYPYSVAQHSVAVASQMFAKTKGSCIAAMIGLLHDVHEAFIGDLSTPLKRHMLDLGFDFNAAVADPIDDWIYSMHRLSKEQWPVFHKIMHEVDSEMGTHEGRALVRNYQVPEGFTPTFPFTPGQVSASFAKDRFLAAYHTYKPHLPRG